MPTHLFFIFTHKDDHYPDTAPYILQYIILKALHLSRHLREKDKGYKYEK